MSRLKIAQLACYRGNIGDNANLVGTRSLLEANLARDIAYTDLEYLEYEPDPRWGGRKFDDGFVDIANRHDLLLIGGGGFFELAVDASATGTPIDISPETLDKIEVPIVCYALGFDVSAGVTAHRLDRFRDFLEHLLRRDRTLVSLRNDGSMENLRTHLGDDLARKVAKVPDGGFFTVVRPSRHVELPAGKRVIGINLAGDALATRFADPPGQPRNLDAFLQRLAKVLNARFEADADLHAVLVPHIPEDLQIIWRFMDKIGPPNMRKRLTVAPYLLGREAQDYLFDLYRRCDLVVGMRFHANVCPIGLGVPTIGIVTHPQIAALYRELGLAERAIRPDHPTFPEALNRLIDDSIARRVQIQSRFAALRAAMQAEVSAFHRRIASLLGLHDSSRRPAGRAMPAAALTAAETRGR